MDLIDFYRTLLPESGNFALWFKGTKQHVWADSLDDLAAKTERTNVKADWYYATASFDGEKRRRQDNVAGKKCFYLDLDAGADKLEKHGPGEVYATNEDAQRAVVEFCKAVRLPPTMIVHSGGGLHVYFALDQVISEEDWTLLAHALAALTKAHGLKVDHACTTDSARVLRPVGALHSNGNRVRVLKFTGKLYTYDELRERLAPAEAEQFSLSDVKPRQKLNVNDTLNMWEPQPASAFKAAEKCATLNYVAQRGGDVPEPLWRAMLGVVKFSVEGEAAAHEWSRGYDGYDPAETAEKFERYEGTGPTRCDTFRRLCDKCDGCEHKVSSPLQLGRLTVEQVEKLPEEQRPEPAAPAPVKGGPFDGIEFGENYRPQLVDGKWSLMARKVIERETEEGTQRDVLWVRVCDDVLWARGWTVAGSAANDVASINVYVYHNATKTTYCYPMPTVALASTNDLLKWLYGRAVSRSAVDPASSVMMHNYVNHQFNLARTMPPQLAIRNRFGLQYEHDGPDAPLICAHGKYVIRADGSIEEAILGGRTYGHRNDLTIRPLPPSPSGHWKPTVWAETIIPGARQQVEFFRKYYRRPAYEIAQLAIMLSISSPLMVFAADTQLTPGAQLPPAGLTVSLYSSSSGQGKTSMQRAVASCYGDPANLVLSGSNQDATPVYQSAFAAVLGTMPYFLDEVTQNTPTEVGALVNRLANGSDRRRGNRDGTPRDAHTWALIASVSTNIPQREMLAAFQKSSDALQMRLIELTCEFPKIEQGAHVDYERDRDTMLAPNYGCLGAVLNLMIVRAGPERIRQLVQGKFKIAAQLIPGSGQRERFMQRGMACVLACQQLLENAGLALFDTDTLTSEYVKATSSAVEYTASLHQTPDERLRRMISDFSAQIIVTHGYSTTSEKIEPVVNRQQLRGPFVGRRVLSGGFVYLLADHIRAWCAEHQISYSELLAYARGNGLLRVIEGETAPGAARVRITRGTDLSLVAGNCFAIDEARLFADETRGDNVVALTKKESPHAHKLERPGFSS